MKQKKKKWIKNKATGEMPFLEHLKELRNRLIVSSVSVVLGAVVAYILYEDIIQVLSRPFMDVETSALQGKLFMTSLFEGFQIKVKVSFLVGVIFSIPVHVFNSVRFIFPGLKKKEKRVISFSLIASTVLIIGSVQFAYNQIIPLSVKFLTSRQFLMGNGNVGILLNFGKNIFYILQFLLAGLVLFQLPLVAELLMIMKIVTRKKMLGLMRYIIVGVFILSAVLTPPDIISQLFFSLPLIVLFLMAILFAFIFRFGEEEK